MSGVGPQAHRDLRDATEEDTVDEHTYLRLIEARHAELLREARADRLGASVRRAGPGRFAWPVWRRARPAPRLRRA